MILYFTKINYITKKNVVYTVSLYYIIYVIREKIPYILKIKLYKNKKTFIFIIL